MTQTVTLKEVRDQLSELVSRVAFGDQKVVITRFGKPVAALVTYEDYEKLMNPASRFTDEEWQKGFEFIDTIRENTKKYPVKDVKKAIKQAIQDVRSSKKRV